MKTIALTDETEPARMQSRVKSVVQQSRPHSSALSEIKRTIRGG